MSAAAASPTRLPNSIVEGIAAALFRPGMKLVEADIAAQLSVSRIPVREAFKILEVQGILISAPGRGVKVAQLGQDRTAQVREMRTEVEKIVARDASATLRKAPAMAARLDLLIEEMRHCAARDDWMGVNKCDLAFHRALCEISGNLVATTLWEALARHTRIIFGQETRFGRSLRSIVEEHVALRRTLLASAGDELAELIVEHINHADERGG